MLTRIVHNSPSLGKFFDQLIPEQDWQRGGLPFSAPQRQHLLEVADALLVCPEDKTLAALQRQYVETTDVSNWADSFRIAPWSADELRSRLRAFLVHWATTSRTSPHPPPPILLSLDDSLGEKDRATCHLEPVDWHYDHLESTKNKPRYKKGVVYLVCTLRVGALECTVDVRLYLRQRTVRRLNRSRPSEQRLSFISKTRLARQMLLQLLPLLPKGWPVYVLIDSWYASARLIKFIRRQGWHAVGALKHNRKLNGLRLDHHACTLQHQRYTQVRLTAADAKATTYWVRPLQGRLEKMTFDVCVWVSKRHPREKSPAYFFSTDLTLTAQQGFQTYQQRWSCEVANWYLKVRLGLADFRLQPYEAVDKWVAVVHFGWAYVQWRFARERSTAISTPADLIRRHQDEHTRAWLLAACQLALQTGSIEPVLQRFLREEG